MSDLNPRDIPERLADLSPFSRYSRERAFIRSSDIFFVEISSSVSSVVMFVTSCGEYVSVLANGACAHWGPIESMC